jgi:hypothetical protein
MGLLELVREERVKGDDFTTITTNRARALIDFEESQIYPRGDRTV